ncbi:DEAD/DEAH box helicase [Listeria ilorinensis]|uniref:SNF2-related protein n=1 Tax=Listeria ilorinensis TaxID=2867439 RepID=UPI001EF6C2EE|nr:DEAD/DEAH box helicase [Listeria ilorinensis]
MHFKTPLLPHQIKAVEKIGPLKVGGLLMDMGTGKTRTIFEIYMQKYLAGKVDKILYVCPFSVKETIEKEFSKHFNEVPPHTIVGYETISNSNGAYMDLLEELDERTFFILDESHYIKNFSAKRTTRIIELGKKVSYRFIMTGTAITKHVEDLFAQFFFLDKRILGYQSFYDFADNHLEYSIYNPNVVVKSLNLPYLTAKIQPYVYQVKKSDCLLLPNQSKLQYDYDFTPESQLTYFERKTDFLGKLERFEKIRGTDIFQMFTELQKIADTDDNKLSLVKKCAEELDGLKIIYFKFIDSLNKFKELSSSDIFEYSGQVSYEDRQLHLAKWRLSKHGTLLLTYQSGSHSLNLQDAKHVLFANKTFNFALRHQAEDRIHRIGQDNTCQYFDFTNEQVIELYIDKSIAKKENLVKKFTEEVKKVKENTNADIREELRKLWDSHV